MFPGTCTCTLVAHSVVQHCLEGGASFVPLEISETSERPRKSKVSQPLLWKNENLWFQKISTAPHPPNGRDLPYGTPSPVDFPKSAPKIYYPPLPSGISKIFAHPLEILLSLIITKVNKEVVLFPRMPNFVSFVYFLLNCITDKRIPYANSLCAQVTDKFCAFHVISVEFNNSANEMQGRVANITVLFSHCVKKKATLEEV